MWTWTAVEPMPALKKTGVLGDWDFVLTWYGYRQCTWVVICFFDMNGFIEKWLGPLGPNTGKHDCPAGQSSLSEAVRMTHIDVCFRLVLKNISNVLKQWSIAWLRIRFQSPQLIKLDLKAMLHKFYSKQVSSLCNTVIKYHDIMCDDIQWEKKH